MGEDFSVLRDKEYPGRVIIIGRDLQGKNCVIVYAITGRSPSSQARMIEITAEGAWVKPTDEEILAKGNRELLIYPAILYGQGIAVSNGRQTVDIRDRLSPQRDPVDILSSALNHWKYEPDAPTYTPRISGCVLPGGKAALGIIKRHTDGSSARDYIRIPMLPGEGKMIATYSGKNKDPLPSFEGEPQDVSLIYGTPEETAQAVDSALKGPKPEQDFRVAVACVFYEEHRPADLNISVINRSEKRKNEQDR
jgi:IMP cyclohydrolase